MGSKLVGNITLYARHICHSMAISYYILSKIRGFLSFFEPWYNCYLYEIAWQVGGYNTYSEIPQRRVKGEDGNKSAAQWRVPFWVWWCWAVGPVGKCLSRMLEVATGRVYSSGNKLGGPATALHSHFPPTVSSFIIGPFCLACLTFTCGFGVVRFLFFPTLEHVNLI